MAQKLISQATSKSKQMTNFNSEDVKRSILNEATKSCQSFYQNDRFSRNCWPLKISLLQCYEVLWIPNIDAICTLTKTFSKGIKRLICNSRCHNKDGKHVRNGGKPQIFRLLSSKVIFFTLRQLTSLHLSLG